MSHATFPPVVPIIGADQELQVKLRDELKSTRLKKRKHETVKHAYGNQQVNRRQSVRYDLSLPAFCYPVLANGEVDHSACLEAIVDNISAGGIRLLTQGAQPSPGQTLLIGIETPSSGWQFASGSVTCCKKNQRNMVEVSACFDGYLHELLQNEMVFPVLDRTEMQFRLPYPERTLSSLCKIGAATELVLDHVTVCPQCQGVPTVRTGCSLCLSSKVQATRMIHHFPCANVDFVEKFETESGLRCEKCRTQNLVIGSDYEYLDGPNQCQDCGNSNLAEIQIGHCLNCEHRFPWDTGTVLEITGYRVNRLDSLDIIDSH